MKNRRKIKIQNKTLKSSITINVMDEINILDINCRNPINDKPDFEVMDSFVEINGRIINGNTFGGYHYNMNLFEDVTDVISLIDDKRKQCFVVVEIKNDEIIVIPKQNEYKIIGMSKIGNEWGIAILSIDDFIKYKGYMR